MNTPMPLDDAKLSAWLYQQWARELREIEARKYAYPLDYTRAAILRSSMRAEQGGC